ncbi:NGG1p interacting factor 3 protein, NIF3 [Coxiella endosymbiont of Amblyomma americanum]|uniref:NGG1p interacting factor 3 protein, NIF3 n=1 Tax=Coxiella endosymbiont of Amblyomma americanum TaxID=325775 RepID=UPI00057F8DC5|nr:NGG1p interacting factor 3 protein, NIF3 [Coxiella endosymbiont of Amblyomma americanum]AJC50672.1 NGG1p interacting factor 3 protein, NIF3 [Coxiella endosymbiont of Amblyomma americanum]AUJ58996.1 NGG1p interacting factor NIF3 [Coxiella-like endosymbiont of Amblyomma americanum]
MYKLAFYVPENYVEQVKNALFTVGAGQLGNYDCCAWQTLGVGQYRPLNGSQPYIGLRGRLETIKEYLVEMICEDKHFKDVIEELIRVHPYETPSYAAWKIDTLYYKT